MHALIRMLAAAVALAMSTGTAFAVMGKTNTDVALRTAPAAQAELILNLSKGTLVNVGSCSRGWCRVTWNKYGGYVRQSALQFQSTPASGPPAIPVYPPYPYKAGHYPTADAYYDLPPYAATNPSFYHWRYFLTARSATAIGTCPTYFVAIAAIRKCHCQQLRDPGAGERTNVTEVAAQDGAQSGWSSWSSGTQSKRGRQAPSPQRQKATRCTRTEPPSAKHTVPAPERPAGAPG